MEESLQASVKLVGTADHTGCGVQHSLQFVGRRFRRTRQDSVANEYTSVAADSDTILTIRPVIAAYYSFIYPEKMKG